MAIVNGITQSGTSQQEKLGPGFQKGATTALMPTKVSKVIPNIEGVERPAGIVEDGDGG